MTATARTEAVLVDENNSAAGYGDGPSSAAGGFMYLGLSEVTFDIADGKTLVLAIQRMTELLTLLLVPG
ncbi:adhesin [Escherichia coli]|nr:adhesin [Escherichia coli]